MNYKQIFVTSLLFFFWCKPEFAILTYVILLLLLLQNMVFQALETVQFRKAVSCLHCPSIYYSS